MSSPSTIRSLGAPLSLSNAFIWYTDACTRWHEHDPEEIIETCDTCITDTCTELEAAGWSKDSVKVIGGKFTYETGTLLIIRSREQVSPINVRQQLRGAVKVGDRFAVLLFGMIVVQKILSFILSTSSRTKVSRSVVPSRREATGFRPSGDCKLPITPSSSHHLTYFGPVGPDYLFRPTSLPLSYAGCWITTRPSRKPTKKMTSSSVQWNLGLCMCVSVRCYYLPFIWLRLIDLHSDSPEGKMTDYMYLRSQMLLGLFFST